MSSIRWRTVIPCGASYAPGRTTLPERQKSRVPVESGGAPICANSAGPTSSTVGTFVIVSTLLISVGDAYRPEIAGNGGFDRGWPRFPSSDSSSAVSSPQMYAPAPRWITSSTVAEQAGVPRLVDRGLQHLVLRRVLAADVDEDVARLDRVRGDQAALDQPVRDLQHDLAVLERPGLGLVGVDREVDRLRDLVGRRDEARLASRREEGAAAAAQVRLDQLAG